MSATFVWSAAFRSPTRGAGSARATSINCLRRISPGRVLKGWALSGNVTLQDGTPLNPFYFARGLRQLGHAQPAEHRARPIDHAAAQPAHHRTLFQHGRVFGPGAVHVRQRRPRHHPRPRQQHFRFRAARAASLSASTAPFRSARKPSTFSTTPTGASPAPIRISDLSSDASSRAANRAGCSSRCGMISEIAEPLA